jgi:hypothetical protein
MSLGDLGVMLNVAIALIFLYLAVSLACSAALEALAGWFQRRARMLKQRIQEMLNAPAANALYETSIIKGLSAPNALPNYIPAVEFASGVIEMATKAGALDQSGALLDRSKMPTPLAVLHDEAKGDLDAFKARIGLWYDNAMARLTGKYDRWSQLWLFLLGILLAALFNLDSLSIGSALWADRARLEPLVQQVETWHGEASNAVPTDDAGWNELAADPQFRQAVTALVEQLPAGATIPLGYKGDGILAKAGDAWTRLSVLGIVGWLITGLAAMLGAKFWFNALGQALQLRAAGIRPQPAEATTSPQRANGPPAPSATPAAGGSR